MLSSFFLNRSKDHSVQHHPKLAWAYHVHGMMISFFEDVLQTDTSCANSQMRNWQRANRVALAVLEKKPLPFSLSNKDIYLDEISALREDLQAHDLHFSPLAAQRYLTLSQIYFDHFSAQGLDSQALKEVEMLAEQAVILAHPYVQPDEAQIYKLYVAHACLIQLSWDQPLYDPDELPAVIRRALSKNLHEGKIKSHIAESQARARAQLRQSAVKIEPITATEREKSSQKIRELHARLASPNEDSWSKLNIGLNRSEFSLHAIEH